MDYNISSRYFKLFSDLIYEKSGINIKNGKEELLQARIAKILRKEKIKDYKELYEKVKDDRTGRYMTILLNAVSTNKTSFFREDKHFEFLSKELLKELEIKKKDLSIRCWSAACSSGEEPYSLATTILDTLKNPNCWNIKILGTDISYDVLEKAVTGTYPYSCVSSVPKFMLQKYFRKENGGYTASNQVKNIITFKWLNLIEPFLFRNPFDFIFCRNVMIYFDTKTKQQLLDKMYSCLVEGGYFFIGLSESLTGINHNFKYIMPSVYRK